MSSSLLNINVDLLFEQYSIAEIEQIQKRLEVEVENKKENLKTMVGERYRDLLQAADTISVMKKTSGRLVHTIDEISLNCKDLNEKQLIGFKSCTNYNYSNSESQQLSDSSLSTVIQIKLLIDLPTIIWNKIDDGHYFVAAQLYLLARHIYTGLKLDANKEMMTKFPVAEKQWDILKQFHFHINSCAVAEIEKFTLSTETSTDCLLSIFLLENDSPQQLLEKFLQYRKKTYITMLSSEESARMRVTERIISSLKILISTVDLVKKCFSGIEDNGKGLIFEQLENLNKLSTPAVVYLADFEDAEMLKFLPDIITNYKPSWNVTSLSDETLKINLKNWVSSISEIIGNQLKNLFKLITSMKTLQQIQKQCFDIPNSNHTFKELNLNFYETDYKKLIDERLHEIIYQSWNKLILATQDDILHYLKSLELERESRNSKQSLWKDSLTDIPQSLKAVVNQDKKENKLLIKRLGFNQKIVEVCSTFDNNLKVVHSDLELFLKDKLESYEELDDGSLLSYFIDIGQQQIAELVNRIKQSDFTPTMQNFVALALILNSLIELCPNFRRCFSSLNSNSSNNKNVIDAWHQVHKLIEQESFGFWRNFCDKFFKEYSIEKWMKNTLDHQIILEDFVKWESIIIEETDEEGNPLQSNINVPYQIRISLQKYFFEITNNLVEHVPQGLPKDALNYFCSLITKTLIEHYSSLSENPILSTNQNIALQIYFDLKFLQLMLITRDDKKQQDSVLKLINQLKNYIDPFDFELFHSHINNNVKKCAFQVQHLLGIFLPNMENILNTIDVKQISYVKDSNILCLSSNETTPTWFTLLPATVVEKPSSQFETKQKKSPSKSKTSLTTIPTLESTKQQPSEQSATTYASNVKSSAAAFFGAMSQDWFR